MGVMGASQAGHLVKAGWEVKAYGHHYEKVAAKAPEFGFIPCRTIAEAVADADFVFVMVGYPADVEEVLRFLDATPEECDYSAIGTFAPPEAQGACVYCNHCLPCPAGIDVGLVNKYYDLARAGDALAVEHYRQLSTSAADCLACGHCESRCPFGVAQEERMQEIATYFNYSVEKHPNKREQYGTDN